MNTIDPTGAPAGDDAEAWRAPGWTLCRAQGHDLPRNRVPGHTDTCPRCSTTRECRTGGDTVFHYPPAR